MSLLSSPQQTELEKPVTRTVYFIELQFSGGTSRFSSFNQTITWGGYDWSGLGQVLMISEVAQSEGADARALNIGIATQASLLAVAIGPVTEYRGRPVNIYMCPLDESYSLVGTPALAWRGIMDTAAVGIDGNDGSINIKCETSAYALKRRPVFRINAAQHKSLNSGAYVSETGLDYLTDLIANPQRWLSRRFMSI